MTRTLIFAGLLIAATTSSCQCGPESADAGVGTSGSRDVYRPDVVGLDLWFAQDAQIFNEAGLTVDVRGVEAGIASYQGAAEPGVICGDTTCVTQAACCLGQGLPPTLYCDSGVSTCPGALIGVACDGPEDCPTGEECCGDPQFNTSCVAEGSCYGSLDAGYTNNVLICVDDSDCRGDFMCCSAALAASLGLDVGWCLSYCS